MISMPELINKQSKNQEDVIKGYIQSLRKGNPIERPTNLGIWETIVQNIEQVYTKSNGDLNKVSILIDGLSSQGHALFDILSPPAPSLEEVVKEDKATPTYPPLPLDVALPPELSFNACRFLDAYEHFSKGASPEGYGDFHIFCGMWLLSVVAARRIYLPLKRKKMYTNLMIAMCARTSLFAKSSTGLVAKDILNEAGLSYLLGPDRATPAKLLSDMAGNRVPENYDDLTITKQEILKKRLAMSGQRGLFFDEFGKFIQAMLKRGSSTSDFAELFLTLDSCPIEYENSTISRGGETIKRPYLPLLGAMTPANLRENACAGADFWTDGFWARFSFVVAPIDEYKDAPLDVEELAIPSEIIDALRHWHQRLGVPECRVIAEIDTSAGRAYKRYDVEIDDLQEVACTISKDAHDAWKRYRTALKRMLVDFNHEDFHGSYTRLPETAMRMAILMASLENNNRIEMQHWAKAQELAELLRKNLHELYSQVNINQTSHKAKVEVEVYAKMLYLAKKGIKTISVSQMKNSYMKSHSLKDLKDIMDNMVRVGVLKKEITPHSPGKYSIVEGAMPS